MTETTPSHDSDFFIDITNEVCPMTFVKTKLALEKLQPGNVLEVRLKGKEPLNNVPRSAKDHGNRVLSLEREDSGQPDDGVHRLMILKQS